MKELTISGKESGQRLDKYLKKLLPNAGTGFLYRMLRKKNITLNGGRASGPELLREGDCLRLFFSEKTYRKFTRDQLELEKELEALGRLPMRGLKVVYEDEDILAADKPYNMLSQKAAKEDLSANEYLLGYLVRSGALSAGTMETFRPSVCNRLDRNTTGLILMGKTLQGSQLLSEALKERSIGKYYRAIVAGEVEARSRLRGYLLKDEVQNRVQLLERAHEGAVYVETEYRPLMQGNGCTLLEVHLITGRTHQIRAHLASIGHPVIGDPKYGDVEMNQKMQKFFHVNHQLLHAYRVELADGRVICADCPAVFDRVIGG